MHLYTNYLRKILFIVYLQYSKMYIYKTKLIFKQTKFQKP